MSWQTMKIRIQQLSPNDVSPCELANHDSEFVNAFT